MYAAANPLYRPNSYQPAAPQQPVYPAPPATAISTASPLGRDTFIPSTSYAPPSTSYAPPSTSYAPPSTSYAPPLMAPPALESIPGTPERMKLLTKQVMAPYFEEIAHALRNNPEVSMAVAYGVYSDDQKLRLVERVKQLISGIYNLPPIATQVLDEPWVGGGYSFDNNLLYTITTGLLKDATPGDLIYLTVHEMTHAFQHRMVSFPIPPGGSLGELTSYWRGNTPQTHSYVSYTGVENFELYAEQPLEFAAFLGGNFAEYQLTGRNNRPWGTNETEAWDLYA